ncbi:MAG TPA: DNA primase [bacterium]|nr:DNA primase [bacterium]
MAFSEVNRLVSERIPLDKIISKYVKLEPSSKGFKGLCPFHNEKTPSFYVNTVENFFYCFGCGVSGNAITFLMLKDGYSFSDAIKKLGEEFNIPELIKENPEIDSALEKERAAIFNANKVAAKIFIELLEENAEALKYLEERAVTNEIRKKFGIGFVGSGERFVELMKERGVDMNTMMRAGLIRLDSYSRPVSFFYNRIIIPIIHNKNVIGFGGRIFSGNGPKYLNSPDTIVFNKGENIFGIDFVREGLKSFPFVVLCEGYFDVIAMHRRGFCTAVASLGTAITETHLEILDKFNKPVVLFLDGDEAGRKAARRIAKLKIPEKIDLRAAFIKQEGEDPDSLLRKDNGDNLVRDLIELSRPLFQELIDEQLKIYNSLDNLEEKIKVEDRIREIVKNIPQRKLRTYHQYILKNSGNSIKIFYDRDKRIAGQLKKAENGLMTKNEFSSKDFNERLKRLAVLAALHNEFIPALENVKDVFFSSDLAIVYEQIVKCYFEGEDPAEISLRVDPEGTIASEFEQKELNFIERTFRRELSYVRFQKNNELIKILQSDESPESHAKKWELTLENRKLKEIIADNEIKEPDKSEEC